LLAQHVKPFVRGNKKIIMMHSQLQRPRSVRV